jgi:hypothetical protein
MRAVRFVSERIDVMLKDHDLPEKRPGCPASFVWRDEVFTVVECLSEWRDYARRGKMARNMMPQHVARAEQTGSWGVGRYYHRVRTDSGRVFDVYYDRAPSSATDRKGGWFLFRELAAEEGQ